MCPLRTLECNSREELTDAVASKYPDMKKLAQCNVYLQSPLPPVQHSPLFIHEVPEVLSICSLPQLKRFTVLFI